MWLGTAGGDFVELTALNNLCFGNDKKEDANILTKFPIGSIKTNIGHCEAASGLLSVIKVCLAYRNKILPANLHYTTPRKSILDLLENKFLVE